MVKVYDYDELYEKIIKSTQTVNLPARESVKIVDKIYNDLEIGILKPRNINKRCHRLICNSLSRQKGTDSGQDIKKCQAKAFIERIRPKVNLTDLELEELELRLMELEKINTETLKEAFREYLSEIGNHSLSMIKNQDFRVFDQAIISIENPKLANRFDIYDQSVLLYSFISHEDGILFELLTGEYGENPILTKRELDNEIISYIDREDLDESKYGKIRQLKIIDEFRDPDNPDIVTVKFIKDGKSERLRVLMESIVESRIIGYLVDEPKVIEDIAPGREVVISYCYDVTDEIHLYVKGDTSKISKTIKDICRLLKNPSRKRILDIFSRYRDCNDFDFLADTFHSIIFDYFRDMNEFYKELDKEAIQCI